jgi:hypothetical protein
VDAKIRRIYCRDVRVDLTEKIITDRMDRKGFTSTRSEDNGLKCLDGPGAIGNGLGTIFGSLAAILVDLLAVFSGLGNSLACQTSI